MLQREVNPKILIVGSSDSTNIQLKNLMEKLIPTIHFQLITGSKRTTKRNSPFKGKDLIIICCDLLNPVISDISDWNLEIETYSSNIPVIVVGFNDISTQASMNVSGVKRLAKDFGYEFLNCLCNAVTPEFIDKILSVMKNKTQKIYLPENEDKTSLWSNALNFVNSLSSSRDVYGNKMLKDVVKPRSMTQPSLMTQPRSSYWTSERQTPILQRNFIGIARVEPPPLLMQYDQLGASQESDSSLEAEVEVESNEKNDEKTDSSLKYWK